MTNQKNNKVINVALWVGQVLLALMFLMSGAMKLFQPIGTLAESIPWVTSTPIGLVRFIGVSEFFGALGLLLPSILRIKPFLTIWASLGLVVVMVLAAGFHGSRGEYETIGVNLVLAAIALFVAWGRGKKVPIYEK